MNSTKHIILFDGVCNLCNKSIDFLIRKDKKYVFKYASLQSKFALQNLNLNGKPLKTIMLLQPNGITLRKSKAVLQIAYLLGFPYSLLTIFKLIPTFISDFAYDLVAKNRYRLFGKTKTCRLPSEEKKSLFIE